jgi:hypothetical protein
MVPKTKSQIMIWLYWIIGIFVVIKLYKFFFPKGVKDQSNTQNLEVDKTNVTYPLQNFVGWANEIQNALHGAGLLESWTEDEQTVIRILSYMRTDDDVFQLINEYGQRGGNLIAEDNRTLPVAIIEYLSEGDIEQINNNLQLRNIQYRF